VTQGSRAARLVLDTTAMTAWCRGSIAVGELLAEVNDENGAALVPLSCLVEANHLTASLEREYLELLLEHPATVLVADDPQDWPALAELRTLTGGADSASAALLALDAGADVLTRDPQRYAGIKGGRITLPFQ
jgi:hypothetical protein